jgi:hypothetical protein
MKQVFSPALSQAHCSLSSRSFHGTENALKHACPHTCFFAKNSCLVLLDYSQALSKSDKLITSEYCCLKTQFKSSHYPLNLISKPFFFLSMENNLIK